MPRNPFQEVVYGLFMSFFMVMAMELYNTGLRLGELTAAGFFHVLGELWFMLPICFCTSFFGADRIVPRFAYQIAVPGRDHPLLVTVTRACMTVCVMCPVMSLWATLLFKHPGAQLVGVWLKTLVCNFPMALCWQVFFCGPLVRLLFRTLFRRQLAAKTAVPAR